MALAHAEGCEEYAEFLRRKLAFDPPAGIASPPPLHETLFPFQRDIASWALRRGRAAIFADCGMGKTFMQVEWARVVSEHTGGRVLILAPLAVAQQTVREARKLGIDVEYARRGESTVAPITITNYEMLEHFDASNFAGIVLDESSILKAYDGKTRTAIIDAFARTPYRLACTATPAPNDHMELANHAEFLGVMTRAEMLSMFFVHDGGETQAWRLKGHAVADFWKWVCSWAVMLRKPSDLGYEDDGFTLPPLKLHHSTVESEALPGYLFPGEAGSLQERIVARRESVEDRAAACASLVNGKPGAWVVWCNLNAEADAVRKLIPDAMEIRGSDNLDEKESRLEAFARGDIRVLVTKPSIAGHGLNWQHCANVAFLGLSDSWEQYYQAVRRCWRFGQRNEVNVHVITAESEGAVVRNIERKERDAAKMAEEMVSNMHELNESALHGAARTRDEYRRDVASGRDWTMHLGDCVEVLREMESESVHYSVFSPPFASLYTYSASERDMGNCRDDETFATHLRFVAGELLRVLKPGRLLSFHCMLLPTSKQMHGHIGLRDFRGELIRMFVEAGFIHHSEVVIWKDPVTAMQRTKALGLLYKQLRKDSCMSRQGVPDYLVTMRKPGENDERVSHEPDDFPLPLWQRYASPIWTDIDDGDTLQRESAREERDERHICPLQLEVIRRALKLWTNPGDLVLSPFAGIGSEGYVAVEEGRRFVGAELKESYWRQACANLRVAQEKQTTLFDEAEA